MLVKVLIGNCIQLWLQSSFFALTWDFTGREAKAKVICSMIVSAAASFIRCKIVVSKLGAKGMILAAMSLFIVGLSGAKVYFSFKCDSHLWNLSTGCVVVNSTAI